tara:strand:+ start:803 stop:1123 length:321 start_codon:yes stop_codon:yes gene_type:complete
MSKKFLYFDTASDDATAFPAENIAMIDQNGDGTILMTFANGGVTDGSAKTATVTLNVTGGSELNCIKDIARAIAHGRGPVVIIADDTDGVYASTHITDCGAISLTA